MLSENIGNTVIKINRSNEEKSFDRFVFIFAVVCIMKQKKLPQICRQLHLFGLNYRPRSLKASASRV